MNTVKIVSRVQGRYKFIRRAPDGTVRQETDWMDNLILDSGLDAFGQYTGDLLNLCQVGSGNTAPNIAQTALSILVASSETETTSTAGAQPTAPYFGWKRKTFRFAAGVAAGNLAEVGIGYSVTNNLVLTKLISRALIVDGGGSPTTITILSDEILDVIYELRQYPPLVDAPFTVSISGVDYDCIRRAANVISATAWGSLVGDGAQFLSNGSNDYATNVYTGVLGAITGEPTGTAGGNPIGFATITSQGTYTLGTFQRQGVLTWPVNNGNLSGGIGAIKFATTKGQYQIQFSPKIPKDSFKELTLNVVLSWTRYVP